MRAQDAPCPSNLIPRRQPIKAHAMAIHESEQMINAANQTPFDF
jgi:hypothetical protein